MLSRFAFGREFIRQRVGPTLGSPTHRPLAYELVAHLCKHRFIDNVQTGAYIESAFAVKTSLDRRGILTEAAGYADGGLLSLVS